MLAWEGRNKGLVGNLRRWVEVHRKWRPVTNGEFYQFYIGLRKGNVPLPASWVEEASAMKVCVRTPI